MGIIDDADHEDLDPITVLGNLHTFPRTVIEKKDPQKRPSPDSFKASEVDPTEIQIQVSERSFGHRTERSNIDKLEEAK